MSVAARAVLDSPEMQRLVARCSSSPKGFILLVAPDKDLLARRVGVVTTLGTPSRWV